jgi:hypothetical protein
MLKERLRGLFESYDLVIQQIVNEVVELEQSYISKKNPRGIRPEIDEIITRIAKEQPDRQQEEEGGE